MTTSIFLFALCALLVNVYFYVREIRDIWGAVKARAKKTNKEERVELNNNLKAAVSTFVTDISVSGLVVMLAGVGLYSFAIGAIGGAVVSLVLWRNQLLNIVFGIADNSQLAPAKAS